MKSIIMKIVFICLLLATSFFVVSETFLDDYFEKDLIKDAEGVDHTGGYIYFLKPSTWTESKVMMFIGHNNWTSVYEMTKVSNTDNLYLYSMPSWGGATYTAFANDSYVWGEGSWGPNNRTNAKHYTNVKNNYGFNSGSYYICYPSGTGNNATLNIDYKGTTASSINFTTRANVYTNGSSNASGGTVSVSGRYMSNYSTASSRSAVSSTASQAYASTTLAPGSTATFKATANDGYKFVGWYDSSSFETATLLSDNETYTYKYDISYTGKTVYARFVSIYSVTYNGNGATGGTMSNSTHYYSVERNLTANSYSRSYTVTYDVNGGKCDTTSDTSTYAFNGWDTKSDGSGTSYADQASVSTLSSTANGSVILYAQWTGGSVTLPTATKEGYKLIGWFNGTTNEGIAGKSYTPTANTTLKAEWDPITYTVAFHANDGTETVTNQNFTYAFEDNLTANSFSRTGYTFGGWYTSADGTGYPDYTDGQSVLNLSTSDGAVINLYAKWTPITYTIVFHKNDETATGTMDNQTIEYDASTNLTQNTFKLANHTFGAWYLNPELTGTYYADKASVLNLADDQDEIVNLYAYWIKPIYTEFDLNYDTFDMDGVEFDTENEVEYTMSGTKYTTIYPDTDAGKEKNAPSSSVVPINPNYEFLGWFTTENIVENEKPLKDNKYTVTKLENDERVTYYAHWAKTPCFVSGDLIVDYYYEKVLETYEPRILSVGMKFSLNITDSYSNYADENNKYTLTFYDGVTQLASYTTKGNTPTLILTPNDANNITIYTAGTYDFLNCYGKEYSIELIIENSSSVELVNKSYTFDTEVLVTECISGDSFDEKTDEEKKVITKLYDDVMHKHLNYNERYHYGVCSVCGDTFEEEHDFEYIETIGNINYYECKVCSATDEREGVAINVSYVDANGNPIASTFGLRSSGLSTSLNVEYQEKWEVKSPNISGLLPNRPYLSGVATGTEKITVIYHESSKWDGKYPEGEVAWTSGSGTEADPYVITTAEQLVYLQQQSQENIYKDVYFKLGTSIDLGNYQWLGIGGTTQAKGFAGHLDGNNCAIYNLYINADKERSGFFNCITGSVSNLTIVGEATSTVSHVGLLAGYSYATLTNCYVYGNVTGVQYTGLIAGEHANKNVTNCIAYGNVTGTYNIGGLFGVVHSLNKDTKITISSCINNTTVTSTCNDSAQDGVGGIAGYTYSYVLFDDCQNNGDITSTQMIHSVGGIVGNATYSNDNKDNARTNIVSCINFGTITGQKGLGGIVGELNSSDTTIYSNVESCINYGDVIGTQANTGGIVGNLGDYGIVNNNINHGEITVDASGNLIDGTAGIVGSAGVTIQIIENKNYGNVTAHKLLGGIVGYVKASGATIESNFNYGNIECTIEKTDNTTEGHAGGIIGKWDSVTHAATSVEENYNNGTVINVNGVKYVNSYVGSNADIYDVEILKLNWTTNWSSLATGHYVILLSSVAKGDVPTYLLSNTVSSHKLEGTQLSGVNLENTYTNYALRIFVDSYKNTVTIKVGDQYLGYYGSGADLSALKDPFEWKIGSITSNLITYEYLYDTTSNRALVLGKSTSNGVSTYYAKAYLIDDITHIDHCFLQFANITQKEYTWSNDWSNLETGAYHVILSSIPKTEKQKYIAENIVEDNRINCVEYDFIQAKKNISNYKFEIYVNKKAKTVSIKIGDKYLACRESDAFLITQDAEFVWSIGKVNGVEYLYDTLTKRALVMDSVNGYLRAYTSFTNANYCFIEFSDLSPESKQLETPSVKIDSNGKVTWDAVEHARGYAYQILNVDGDTIKESTTNDLFITIENGQSIVIKAIGDGRIYLDSEFSEEVLAPIWSNNWSKLASGTYHIILSSVPNDGEDKYIFKPIFDLSNRRINSDETYNENMLDDLSSYDFVIDVNAETKKVTLKLGNQYLAYSGDSTDLLLQVEAYEWSISDDGKYLLTKEANRALAMSASDYCIKAYAYNGNIGNGYRGLAYAKKLAIPTVTVDPNTGFASWDVVPNATGYVYQIDDEEVQNTPVPVSFELQPGQKIKVMAVDASGTYLNSGYSAEKTFSTETVTEIIIKDHATANSWTNGTKYPSIDVGTFTASLAGGGNTGKYYTDGQNWRMYQSESATLTISSSNNTIVSVTIEYNVYNTGVLLLNSSNITSGRTVEVNANSITFNIGNTGSATNGQVRITKITVVTQ